MVWEDHSGGFEYAGGAGPAAKRRGAEPEAFTVSEINRYIASLLHKDSVLSGLWVKGEISNYRPHYSGHMYFTLKDAASAIKCVMFRSAASRLKFKPENGMQVLAGGNVNVFERDGQYQLYCEEMRAEGVGDLYVAFEQLKEALSREGLFDQARKKPLPFLPGRVCVITSPTGSVVRDILNVSTRRFPKADILVFPVQVQGPGAAQQIARAIALVNKLALADVAILARGGGSLEDLWPFNEETVARAIAASAIPIVSAVGHETDFTIADFAADLRAPTPSAAAELVFPELDALTGAIAGYRRLLRQALQKRVEREKRRLARYTQSPALTRPMRAVEQGRLRVHSAEERLLAAATAMQRLQRARLAQAAGRLNALSPLAVLSRGYAVVSDAASGRILADEAEAAPGGAVRVRLHKGGLLCEVRGRTGDWTPGAGAAAKRNSDEQGGG